MSEIDDVIDVEPDEIIAQRAVLIKQLIKTVLEGKDRAVGKLEHLANGSKITAKDPRTNLSLGSVYRTDPKPVGTETDRAELDDWLRTEYPDKLETKVKFGPPEEVAAVLAEHAPHLLHVAEGVIPDWLREQALKLAATRDVPGTGRVFPDGVLTVKPTDHARQVIATLLAASPIPLKELEGK